MEWFRRYLALYAAFGALVLMWGIAEALIAPTLSSGLLVVAGLAISVASATGFRQTGVVKRAHPPAWAVASSNLGLLALVAGVALKLL